MAVFTQVSALNVARPFTAGGTAIVATGAIAGDLVVIKAGALPTGRGVAIITVVTTADVGGRLSGRDLAVMARKTAADNRGMIEPCQLLPGKC